MVWEIKGSVLLARLVSCRGNGLPEFGRRGARLARRGDAVEGFDRLDRPQAENLLRCQEGVVRMNGDDESAGLEGSRRDPGSRFAFAPRLEVERQVDGADIPLHRRAGNRRVQLGADEGRESLRAEGSRVDNGVAELLEEVIGDSEKVIAGLPVAAAHFPGGAGCRPSRWNACGYSPSGTSPACRTEVDPCPFPASVTGSCEPVRSGGTRAVAGVAPVQLRVGRRAVLPHHSATWLRTRSRKVTMPRGWRS